MGKVAIKIKIMPEGPDVDLEKIKEEIKKKVNVGDMKEVDIGFGLKHLEIMVVFDDKEGGNTDEIENKIKSIKGVADVEIGDVTLL